MKYLCLAYGAEADWKALTKEEQDALLAQDEVIHSKGALMAAVETKVTTVRNKADTLHRDGEANTALLASTLDVIDTIERGVHRGALKTDQRLANDQIRDFLEQHPFVREAVRLALSVAKQMKVAPTPIAVAFYYIGKKRHAQLEPFAELVKNGLGLTSKKDPVWVLRKEILDRFTYGNRAGGARQTMAANIIIAFNAWRAGKKRTSVAWRKDTPVPTVE